MTKRTVPINLRTYSAPGTVAHYSALNYLTPCEQVMFDRYLPRSGAILDLGVGGGRTTPYLARRASRYVGIDYVPAMVEACRTKFPGLDFRVMDAADLSTFSDSSFDAVVCSFNGIDYLFPEESRRKCFQHMQRVLKAGGVLMFSSHNPRAVLIRPQWNRKRLQRTARRFSADSTVLYWLLLAILTAVRSTLACVRAMGATLWRMFKRLPSRMFWRGEGSLVDPAHGGLLTHYWVPDRVVRELQAYHFRLERILGDDYPRPGNLYATDWYYYVFRKSCEK